MMADQKQRVEKILQHLVVHSATLDGTVRNCARRTFLRLFCGHNVPLFTKIVDDALGIGRAELWEEGSVTELGYGAIVTY